MTKKIIEKILINDELYLKLIDTCDAVQFFQVINENQNYFSKFDFLAPKFQSLKETENAILLLMQNHDSLAGASYGLWHNGRLLGLFKINSIDWEESKADVGYWLTEGAASKGFARMTLKALIENCWNNLNLKSVTAHTAVSNHKSHALLEKLGFNKINLIKDALKINGKSVDDFVYQIDRQYTGLLG